MHQLPGVSTALNENGNEKKSSLTKAFSPRCFLLIQAASFGTIPVQRISRPIIKSDRALMLACQIHSIGDIRAIPKPTILVRPKGR
jgi:hypothetical protein